MAGVANQTCGGPFMPALRMASLRSPEAANVRACSTVGKSLMMVTSFGSSADCHTVLDVTPAALRAAANPSKTLRH